MHSIYVEIVCQTILEKYASETEFLTSILNITAEKWTKWKQGQVKLTPEENQKIVTLFSDYEWMLVQKVLRQTIIYPEKRTIAMEVYRKMKLKIAKEWLGHSLGKVDVSSLNEEKVGQQWINLKVTISYDEWGFDDVLTFKVPAILQQSIAGKIQALIEWIDESIDRPNKPS